MVRADRDYVIPVVVRVYRVEMVVARFPAKHAKDNLLNLLGKGHLQIFPIDVALVRKNEAEPLHRDFLLRKHLFEMLFLKLPLSHEDVSEQIVEPADGGVGMNDHSLLENDAHCFTVALERQKPRLPLHPDELKNIGKSEVFQSS